MGLKLGMSLSCSRKLQAKQNLEQKFQLRLAQMQTFFENVDENLDQIINIKEGISILLKDVYKQKEHYFDTRSILGEDIKSEELCKAITEHQTQILKMNRNRPNRHITSQISARFLFNLNNQVKQLEAHNLLEDLESKRLFHELVKKLRFESLLYLYSENQNGDISQNIEDFYNYANTKQIRDTDEERKYFEDAILDKEKTTQTIELLEDLQISEPGNKPRQEEILKLKKGLEDSTLFTEEYQEKNTIFSVLVLYIEYLFKFAPQIQELIIRNYIYQKIKFTASERLLNRFGSRILRSRPTERRKAGDYDHAFLNMVGEFILISMGIISPEIFTLRKFEVSEDTSDLIRDTELERYINHLGLKTNGTVFFNRFDIQNQKASIETDQKIRGFITKTVREYSDEIISAAEFEEYIDEAREYYESLDSEEKKDTLFLRDTFKNLVLEKISKPAFKEFITELLSSYKFHSKIKELYNL